MKPYTLGISPCPNDTFIFEGWITGMTSSVKPVTTFADVQSLNEAAQEGAFDVVKISSGNLCALGSEYQVLQAGGAMGYGCGPLLLGNGGASFDPAVETWLPGKNTTAALLFRLWCEKRFGLQASVLLRYEPFDAVYRALLLGQASQGVVIHEHRFTFKRDGLHLIEDLGAFWEAQTQSPIPLGVIVAKKSLGAERIVEVESTIRASLDWAWSRANLITPFIQSHAQETEQSVMEAHIRMFVNHFSHNMGEEGARALKVLREVADASGLG
jgi:1,4-dihydroxy-6-naphthoate synthase